MSQFGYASGRVVGSYVWPHSRIRRRGLAGYQNLKKRSFFKNAAVYLAVFFAFTLGYVWTRVQVIETGYKLRQLEIDQEKLKEQNRGLMVEAATLRSPQRLEPMAAELGLKRPAEDQVHFLRK